MDNDDDVLNGTDESVRAARVLPLLSFARPWLSLDISLASNVLLRCVVQYLCCNAKSFGVALVGIGIFRLYLSRDASLPHELSFGSDCYP